MVIASRWRVIGFAVSAWLLSTSSTYAHDPVFSPGPHVLFKDGYEVHAEYARDEQGNVTGNEQAVTVQYGISGDWVAGIELPYETQKSRTGTQKGAGDVTLSSKYRFWRNDSLGVQETAAVLLKLKLDSAGNGAGTGTGTTDALLGITYGYESLKWYRWASARYRFNQNRGDLHGGDRLFVDIAGGYRPRVNDYRAPDTVWLLELNGELSERSALNGININATGGNQWFVSPGIMWTLRNFAIKAGIQIPLLSDLNGKQHKTDYRARLEFEWHL